MRERNQKSRINEIKPDKRRRNLKTFQRKLRRIIIPKDSSLERFLKRIYRWTLLWLKTPFKRYQNRKNSAIIRTSEFFDEEWYVEHNPEVIKRDIDPALHYLAIGGFKGSDPSPKFSSRSYLDFYEDVKKSNMNPLLHYLLIGQKEGRKICSKADAIASQKEQLQSIALENRYEAVYQDLLKYSNRVESLEFVEYKQYDHNINDLPAKLITFYLPQYHPMKENNRWWGKGFTEWNNVIKGMPNFIGHYQPHLPGELGFYDLRLQEIQEQQIGLAKNYGIHGFCFYYYWFSGRRIMELPIFRYLGNKELDFPFCLCWANESWTRRWVGSDDAILIKQKYKNEDIEYFLKDIAQFFRDERYIRIDGKPLLLIYLIKSFTNPTNWVSRLRSESLKLGLGDLFIAGIESYGNTNPTKYGADAAVEFPPHYLVKAEVNSDNLIMLNPNFHGQLFDYKKAAELLINKKAPNYPLFRTVMPSWDNTARMQNNSHIFINSSPTAYQNWLEKAIKFSQKHNPENQKYVFINGWNEWSESAYLEPDQKYGYAYLDATAQALMKFMHKE